MKRFLNWDLSEVLYGNIFKIKGPQNLFYLIFLRLVYSQLKTILMFHLLKVDVRYVKRIPLKVVKNVTFDFMCNAFQHIISNLHDIKVFYLFTGGYCFILSYTSCCYIDQVEVEVEGKGASKISDKF